MSSIICIRHRDAIHLITDGAAYTPDGILTSIRNKVVALPNLAAAVYARGPDLVAVLMAGRMSWFQSFDELVDDLERFAPEFYERNPTLYEGTDFKECELYVVGWSEQRGAPEGYMIRLAPPESHWNAALPSWLTAKPGSYGGPVNKVQKLSALCAAPSVSQDDLRATHFPAHLPPEKLDPRVDGLHLFEIQRRKLSVRHDMPHHYAIGGFCMLTTIRRNEVVQTVLARYPSDKIGGTIQPEAIEDWREWRAATKGGRVLAKV